MFGFCFFFKLCKTNLLHLSDIRPRNKYRMQIVTFPRTNTRGKLTKKSCVCSTWKQTSYDTVFTYSFQRLVAPSSPGSEVSVHKHHFCRVVAGAPHRGSRGRYHHSALPHSFSLRQMWARLFRSIAGKWTKQNKKKGAVFFAVQIFFLYPQHLSSSKVANKSPPDAVRSLSSQKSLSHQARPQKAEDLYLTTGLCYWCWWRPPRLQSCRHRTCETASLVLWTCGIPVKNKGKPRWRVT